MRFGLKDKKEEEKEKANQVKDGTTTREKRAQKRHERENRTKFILILRLLERKFRINNYFPRIRIIRVEENRFTSDKIHIKFSKHPFILHELFYRNENVSF